jgi:hypothetical protein
MSHFACPDCQLRFSTSQAAGFPECPVCGGAFQSASGPQAVMGFQLFESDIAAQLLPEAASAAMPIPPRL